jgi:hypothetical protein
MSEYAKPIDVTTSAILEQLARQVKESKQPIPLTRDNEVVAVVQPAPGRKRRAVKRPSAADLAAFHAAAGSWKDHLDLDQFLRDNEASRNVSTRPPVKL